MVSKALPTGNITFLFTDIEASTLLFEQAPDETFRALARHDEIIENSAAENHGFVVRPRGEGDSRFVVFEEAKDAVAAAVLMQQKLTSEPWKTPGPSKFARPCTPAKLICARVTIMARLSTAVLACGVSRTAAKLCSLGQPGPRCEMTRLQGSLPGLWANIV